MLEEFNQKNKLIRSSTDFKYEGLLNWETIKALIKNFEKRIEGLNNSRSFQGRAFNVLVEMLQNAYRHKFNNDDVALYVHVSDQKLYILVENSMSTGKTSKLTDRLNALNDLKQDELKNLFVDSLTAGTINFFNNKGIGLISIRRKSKNKLLYKLTNINQEKSKITIISIIDFS